MTTKKNILAICGSTRQNSTNHRLLNVIAGLGNENFDISFFNGLAKLPAFNPDDDNDNIAPEVVIFRKQLNDADGVIICTPEYAHGVPGSLKNALDWTVSTSDFYHKPTLLITASTDGQFGHSALLETLIAIGAKNIAQLQLLIQFAQTKINKDGVITDEKTRDEIALLLEQLKATIDENVEEVMQVK
jgi:chromate reductase